MNKKDNNKLERLSRNHSHQNRYSIKDKWDKGEIVRTPFGVLLTVVAIALIGFFGSRALKNSRIQPMNSPSYSLMSTPEGSEKRIHSDRFNKITASFAPFTKNETSIKQEK